MWVSYRHQHTDLPATLSFEDKIDVFYAQTFGWQLHIADLIANSGATLEAPGGSPSYTSMRLSTPGSRCFTFV